MGIGPFSNEDASDGPVSPGTAAAEAELSAGQFNTALPTLTNGQQAAIQVDSSARQIIAPLTNTSVIKSQLQDNAGTAVVLGQTTMSASLPVTIASNQSNVGVTVSNFPATQNVAVTSSVEVEVKNDTGNPIPVNGTVAATQSGTWTVQPGNTANTTAWKVDGSAVTQPVSAASLPLPTGASTSALQTTGNSSLSSIDGKLNSLGQKTMANSVPVAIASDQSAVPSSQSGTWTVQPGNTANTTAWKVDGSAVTQPVSAAALPLPAGAATSALQTTGNSSLSSIDTKTPALGQTIMSASQPVTIASNQSAVPVAFSDTSPANQSITALDVGTASLVGANGQVFYTGSPTTNSAATFALSSIENVSIQLNLIGAGGTVVVEVSADGGSFWFRPNVYQISTQSYTNGFTAPFMATVNVAGMTHVRARATVSWTGAGTIIVKESLNSRSVTVADALPSGANVIGGVTQSGSWTIQPLTNTSVVKAQLQDNAGTAVVLGQTTMSASLPITIASNQTALPASQSGTWTVQPGNTANTTAWLVNTKISMTAASPTVVTIGTSTATVIAANASRKGLVLTNTAAAGKLSLGFGVSAVSGSGIVLYPGGSFVMDENIFSTAQINGISTLAGTTVAIQELT